LGFPGLRPKLEWRWEEGFAMATNELTFEEWIDFVDSPEIAGQLRSASKRLRHALIPHTHFEGRLVPRFDTDSDGLTDLHKSAPDSFDPENHSLSGVNPRGANAFVEWYNQDSEIQVALPTPTQWEKAARGVGGRVHPWGNGFDWSFTSGRPSSAEPIQDGAWPPLNTAHPYDLSPYGLLNMAGGVREICRRIRPEVSYLCAGGDFATGFPTEFVTWPQFSLALDNSMDTLGFRLICIP